MLRPFEYKKLWQPGFMVEKLKSNYKLNRGGGGGDGSNNQHQRDVSDVLLVMRNRSFVFFKDYISRTTVSCAMDFKPFPFDKHMCYYEVGTSHVWSSINVSA